MSSDRLRCSACSVNRGQRAPATRPVWVRAEHRRRRQQQQRRRGRSRGWRTRGSVPSQILSLFGPARGGRDRAVEVDEPRRQVALLEPRRGVRTQDDRGGARGVGVDAGRGRDAHGPPAGVRHVARARVDDVVHGPSGPSPGADCGSRRGDGARDDGDGRVGVDECLDVVVADGDPPASRRSRTGDTDVPAQADQHPTARRSGSADRDPVGGQGLRRGAEVELDADRHEHLPVGRVPPHAPPPGGRHGRRCGSAPSVSIAAKSRS